MTTALWPPLPPADLQREEQASLKRELDWLLTTLRQTLLSLKPGLEDCAALLAPTHGSSTLALSSKHSESLKGFVVRTGARITKGDIALRLATLRPPHTRFAVSQEAAAPTFVLAQLTAVRDLINASLDVIDVALWTGRPGDAEFVAAQLRLLGEYVGEARAVLKGGLHTQRLWWEESVEPTIFNPPLPSHIAAHLTLSDAALLLTIRVLEPAPNPSTALSALTLTPALTTLNVRARVANALGLATPPTHDEVAQTFQFRGEEVRVREKVSVESQDPTLLAVMAKLAAVEHGVGMSRRALGVVMERED